jgi:hypothetical protein
MHPVLMHQMVVAKMADRNRDAVRYRQSHQDRSRPSRPVRTAIELRLSACREELERLAQLSERPLHEGDWLVADVDGVPVAAVSVDDGATVYDPFRPTKQALSLLKLRRKQVLTAAY